MPFNAISVSDNAGGAAAGRLLRLTSDDFTSADDKPENPKLSRVLAVALAAGATADWDVEYITARHEQSTAYAIHNYRIYDTSTGPEIRRRVSEILPHYWGANLVAADLEPSSTAALSLIWTFAEVFGGEASTYYAGSDSEPTQIIGKDYIKADFYAPTWPDVSDYDRTTGSDGNVYKLAADATGDDRGTVADAAALDGLLELSHGQHAYATLEDSNYRYDESLDPAAWVAWNGTDPIAPYALLDPYNNGLGVTSWVKDDKGTSDIRVISAPSITSLSSLDLSGTLPAVVRVEGQLVGEARQMTLEWKVIETPSGRDLEFIS